MQHYVNQLLADIAYATENVASPFIESHETDIHGWISSEEEDETAPVRDFEVWTGLKQEQLPPQEMLSDEQVHSLLEALKKMLEEHNWSFILHVEVPERIQYETIRDNFDQQIKLKQWHFGFFEVCRPGTDYGKCALKEYCHCAMFAELAEGFIDEHLTPEEQRKRELEIEISYLKKKYEYDWKKYYPYHLDKDYDDEKGNPYDYGVGDNDDDDEDDNWRRR